MLSAGAPAGNFRGLVGSSAPFQIEKTIWNNPDIDTYYCGFGATTETKMFYPIGSTAEHPVVLFHRGSSGYHKYEEGYDRWLESVAKQGLIVVAPFTHSSRSKTKGPDNDPTRCKEDWDLYLAAKSLQANWPLSSKVKPDFSRFGLMG